MFGDRWKRTDGGGAHGRPLPAAPFRRALAPASAFLPSHKKAAHGADQCTPIQSADYARPSLSCALSAACKPCCQSRARRAGCGLPRLLHPCEGEVQLPCDDHARWACHPTTATNQRSAGSLAVPISSQVLRPPWVPSLNLATVTTLVPGGECLYMQILEVCRFQTGLSLCVYTRARTCVCSCACCWMWITRCSSVQTRMHRKELKPWTARRDRRRNLCAPGWQQATRHAPGLDTPVPIESVGHGAAHFACCQI